MEMLEDSSIFHLRDHGLERPYIDGSVDVPLESMSMDSLATMELCIAIELRYGCTVVPSDLPRLGSLNGLAARLQAESA